MNLVRSYDPSILKKIDTFSILRSFILFCVLLTTVFLRQEVLGNSVVLQIYAALTLTFFISLISISNWENTLRVRYFIQSQLLYDLLLVSYFVFLTGIDESIYLFLYVLNIAFTALIYRLSGALMAALISGVMYGIIFYINTDITNTAHLNILAYNELLFLITALLSGQFMGELNKQRILLDAQRANIERLEVINDRLLNTIPVGVILLNERDEVQKINQTALHLLHIHRLPENNSRLLELIPALTSIKNIWDNLTDKQKLRYSIEHILPDGLSKKFSIQLVELPEENLTEASDVKKHIIIFQDISKILELEEKLEMESKLAAVGQLAAGIAHEIRNPLASISGAIETLKANFTAENEEDKKLINISLKEVRRLNKLITEFLEFAKPKENNFISTPIKNVVAEVIEAIKSGGKEIFNAEFELAIDSNLSFFVDVERMKQVFLNLFINSMEANQQKLKTYIKIAATSDGRDAIITILDNGPGINPDITKNIFNPFFTTKPSGTGLGLSTVAQIVKSHKGSIRVLTAREGACFELRIPTSDENMNEKTTREIA